MNLITRIEKRFLENLRGVLGGAETSIGKPYRMGKAKFGISWNIRLRSMTAAANAVNPEVVIRCAHFGEDPMLPNEASSIETAILNLRAIGLQDPMAIHPRSSEGGIWLFHATREDSDTRPWQIRPLRRLTKKRKFKR